MFLDIDVLFYLMPYRFLSLAAFFLPFSSNSKLSIQTLIKIELKF